MGNVTFTPAKIYLCMGTKWWKLRGEAVQAFKERMLGEGPWEEGEDADEIGRAHV